MGATSSEVESRELSGEHSRVSLIRGGFGLADSNIGCEELFKKERSFDSKLDRVNPCNCRDSINSYHFSFYGVADW